jgi:glycosyltransferase involved in cell wall biosynthesis
MTQYSLSNKLLEYVHIGLPVIAARLPSYSEYFSDDSAWYWNPGDPESLASAITAFIAANPEERRTRVERAQASLQAIAWKGESERLVEMYADLLTRLD